MALNRREALKKAETAATYVNIRWNAPQAVKRREGNRSHTCTTQQQFPWEQEGNLHTKIFVLVNWEDTPTAALREQLQRRRSHAETAKDSAFEGGGGESDDGDCRG
jgi:hypothetical protein